MEYVSENINWIMPCVLGGLVVLAILLKIINSKINRATGIDPELAEHAAVVSQLLAHGVPDGFCDLVKMRLETEDLSTKVVELKEEVRNLRERKTFKEVLLDDLCLQLGKSLEEILTGDTRVLQKWYRRNGKELLDRLLTYDFQDLPVQLQEVLAGGLLDLIYQRWRTDPDCCARVSTISQDWLASVGRWDSISDGARSELEKEAVDLIIDGMSRLDEDSQNDLVRLAGRILLKVAKEMEAKLPQPVRQSADDVLTEQFKGRMNEAVALVSTSLFGALVRAAETRGLAQLAEEGSPLNKRVDAVVEAAGQQATEQASETVQRVTALVGAVMKKAAAQQNGSAEQS